MYRSSMRCLSLLVMFISSLAVASFPLNSFAGGELYRWSGAFIVMGTLGGGSYTPEFSALQDIKDDYNLFWTDPNVLGLSMQDFDGFGAAFDLIVMLDNTLFVEADVTWQYRNDGETTNGAATGAFKAPAIYNSLFTFALDLGATGEFSKFLKYYASLGVGIAFNDSEGQYPAYANRNVANSAGDAVDYTLFEGLTELYFSNANYEFYFGQLRGGLEFSPSKDMDNARILIGARYIYSQDIQISREDVSTYVIDLPTGIATAVTESGPTAYPSDRSLTSGDLKYPLIPRGRYFMQGQVFKSFIIELGIKIDFGGK